MASSPSVTVSIGADRIGQVERDAGGEAGADVDVARQEFGVAGFEQDVVEGDAVVGEAVLHGEKPPNLGLRGAGRFRVKSRQVAAPFLSH